eukprot:SAG31_NODE_40546_length_280_cov_0.707182_1_plen_79_part_01
MGKVRRFQFNDKDKAAIEAMQRGSQLAPQQKPKSSHGKSTKPKTEARGVAVRAQRRTPRSRARALSGCHGIRRHESGES